MRFALTAVLLPQAALGIAFGAVAAAFSRWIEGRDALARSSPPAMVVQAVLTGAAFAALGSEFGPTREWAIRSLWSAFLLQVFIFDLRHRLVLDAVVLPGLVLAVILSPQGQDTDLVGSILGGAIMGGLFLGLALTVNRIYGGGAMGFGDVKLAAFLGAMLGLSVPGFNAGRAVLFGLVLGAAVVLILMAVGRLSRRDSVPLGPFLAAGAMIILLLPPGYWWPFA
ncbi:MAG: A24 family peptidase [Candidatus Dormibacteria bacterium]